MTPNHFACWSTSTALVALALLTPVDCAASPAIDGTGGIFKHGAAITVSGTGFGTKPQAAPTAFETLESGGFLPYWSNTTGLTVSSNLQRTTRSAKTAYHNFKNGTGADVHGAYLTGSNSILSPTWFVSYWAYLDPNFDWQNGAYPDPPKFLSNVKIFRLWNPGPTGEDFVVATQGWENCVIVTNENTGSIAHWGLSNYPTTHLAPGTWHHLQFAFKENSALGAADGQLLMWVDGRQVMNHSDYITRLNDDVLKRPYIVGFYNSWSPGEGTPDPSDVAPNEFYMDDVYVDTSCARVELGDKPVYSECTHRELQLPTAWSPASLSFTLNVGSFADDAAAYLFVVDADNAASPGYPVRLGSGPAPTTFTEWRAASFAGTDLTNDAVSGPNADPDRCGFTNLARYAFALPARGSVANPITTGTATSGNAHYLTLTFPRRTTATDLTYTLESSPDLVTWTAVPGQTYTAGSGPITAQDAVAMGTAPRRFLRLRVTTP